MLAGAKAQLEQAERDVERYTELFAKNATTQVTLNNARTQVNVVAGVGRLQYRPARKSSQSSSATAPIRAPISGRISTATVKVGNFVRQADTTPLATINPDRAGLCDVCDAAATSCLRSAKALRQETTTVRSHRRRAKTARATGQVTMIENTVDPIDRHGAGPRHHAEHRRSCCGPARWSPCK